MDLKEFIKETLLEISAAIAEANPELSKFGAVANPRDVAGSAGDKGNIYGYLLKPEENASYRRPVHLVEFDVSVTATDKEGQKNGIGVMVAGIGLGTQRKDEASNSIYSRLQFKIPIAFPVGDRTPAR